jgi:predicted NACHT family NTPase
MVYANVLSLVSVDFLPPEQAERIRSSAASGRSFIKMQLEQDEKAVDTMLRQDGQGGNDQANETRPSPIMEDLRDHDGLVDKSQAIESRPALSMEHLFDQLTVTAKSTARFILMASAGFGKTVFLKQLCININQRAFEQALNSLDVAAPVALFVRAGYCLIVYF